MSKIIFLLFLSLFLFNLHICKDNDIPIIDNGYCGLNQKYYNTLEEVHADGTKVLHCGECGYCSNIYDINIYNETRNNLTYTTRECAWKSLFSESWSRSCMEKTIGFTDDCLECWMENILCDIKNCKWICLYSYLINEPYIDDDGNLNSCLQCDEDMCGPAFKHCAGANRRRSCIVSDIFRDEDTICKDCEV